MANLKISFADLYTLVSSFLGLTTTGTAPTGTNLTTCKNICVRGLRQFLYPINMQTGQYHKWSFLQPLYTTNLVSGKWKYQLPEDFSSIITDPTYKGDENFKKMEKVSPEQIMNFRAAGVVNYAPYYYSIVSTNHDTVVGDFDEIWFYPEPDSSYPIQFFYKADPLKPDNATDYLPGGVRSTEAIIESCLAVAEVQEDDTIGIHTQLATKFTQELIEIDSERNNDVCLGNLYSDKSRLYTERADIADLTVYDEDLT